MENMWSVFEKSEIWKYSFNKESLERNNGTYKGLLRQFIMACYTSNLSKLIKENSIDREKNYEEVVEEYLDFIDTLSKLNNKDLYPRITSGSTYNYGKETIYDYTFDNSIYYYDIRGDISHRSINGKQIRKFFNEINHGQKKYKSLALPFEFETYYGIGLDRQVKSFDFVIQFNSDIWLPKVPCSHCKEKISNEVLRKEGGLSQIKNYWHDNKELSDLNRTKMNLFMTKMNFLVEKYEGEVIIEKEDLRLYQESFDKNGFKEDDTTPIA